MDILIRRLNGKKKMYLNRAEIVKEAKSLGANALLNFNITPIIRGTKYGEVVDGYIASGFAVKLK